MKEAKHLPDYAQGTLTPLVCAHDGRTQDAAALAGQTVAVRGIAVKVSNAIMGKNWVHLQDGSGDAGSNDLTVTATNKVEVGAIITASGTLATNLDFGYGYTYAVLLEDAAIETK
jgi:hypothetical protein